MLGLHYRALFGFCWGYIRVILDNGKKWKLLYRVYTRGIYKL